MQDSEGMSFLRWMVGSMESMTSEAVRYWTPPIDSMLTHNLPGNDMVGWFDMVG